jgi:dipeptidyl-peptidase-4
MRFYLSIFTLLLAFSVAAQREVTLEDLTIKGTFRPRRAADFTPMADGQHVAINTGKSIVKMRLGDGAIVDTLFSPFQAVVANDFSFSDFKLSADGNTILLATDDESIYRYTFVAEYFVYNRLTKKIISLSQNGKQQSPIFSPDGKKIAFVRDNNIYVRNLDEQSEKAITTDGEPRKVINGAPDWVYEEEFTLIEAMQWSPDGSKLAYLRFDETQVPEYDMPIYGQNLYPQSYRFKYPKVGQVNSTVSLHVYDFAVKQAVTMHTESGQEDYLPRFFWNFNSSILAAVRLNRHQNKVDVLFCNASGDAKTVYSETDEKAYIPEVTDTYFTFINDKNQFLIQSEKSGFNHIYLYKSNGELVRQITKGNWEVSEILGVDAKSQTIYFNASAVTPSQSEVYSIRFDGKQMKRLTTQSGVSHATFYPGCQLFLHTISTVSSPQRIVLRDNTGKEIRELENNQAIRDSLAVVKMPVKTFINPILPNGTQVNGWLLKPHDFDSTKKYPVLIFVYGGPGSQTVTDEWKTDWYYYLAEKGYIIASFDNRGTGKRGAAFRECTYKHLGLIESDDQISAAHYLAGLSYIDSSRIGIYGWSYGGYMSAMSMLRGGGIFKATASVAPVSDWRFYDSVYTERYMSLPQDDTNGYDASSLMHYAANASGKYLLIHGTADDNVHFQNTTVFSAALVNQNFPFEMQVYTDKDHGINGGYARLHVSRRLAEFFLKNL